MWLVALSACTGPLAPGFEQDLDMGFVCVFPRPADATTAPVWYVAGTADERIRLTADLAVRDGVLPSAGATVQVSVGRRLFYDDADPCDDVSTGRIGPTVQRYEAVAGFATAVDLEQGRIGLVLDDVVLSAVGDDGKPAPDVDDVAIDHAELPGFIPPG